MLTNTDITIFHQGVDPETRLSAWAPDYFPGVFLKKEAQVGIWGDKLRSANVVNIRIPTEKDVAVKNGDKVCIGNVTAPPQNAFTVIGFADNRRGSHSMRHWKLICS